MKRKLVLVILATLTVLSLALAGCGNGIYKMKVEETTIVLERGSEKLLECTISKNGIVDESLKPEVEIQGDSVSYSAETGMIKAEKFGTSVLTLTVPGDPNVSEKVTVRVPAYEITATKSLQLEEGDERKITVTAKKEGVALENAELLYAVTGEAVSFDEDTLTVKALKPGSATITVSLKAYPDVKATVSIEVQRVFFNREIIRGNVDLSRESAGEVAINGGQSTVVYKEDSTKWAFSAKIEVAPYQGEESFGFGSFLDGGDHALWFGLKNNSKLDSKYSVYYRDFYNGWGSAKSEGIPAGYTDRLVDEDCISFELIRDGNNYYYSIDGYYGTYTTEYEGKTFPGVFSQNRVLVISEFAVETDSDEIDKLIAGYANKGIASVVINETQQTYIDRDQDYSYSAVLYPAGSEGTLTWSVDCSELTAGSATVNENGVLKLSADAEGMVTLYVECGGAKDCLQIEAAADKADSENAFAIVKGGVILDVENNVITFPEYRDYNNGVANENKYVESNYMAKLKQTVKGDFSLEFKVSDYKSSNNFPKLMISLGGEHNQIYLAGNYHYGSKSRFELYARGVESDGKYANWGYWFNSDDFEDNFNVYQEHTYRIDVIQGRYYLYVDGARLGVTALNGNGDAVSRMAVRRYEDWSRELNVVFATNAGTSCKVYDVKITEKPTTAEYFYYNGNIEIEDGEIVIPFVNKGWDGRDFYTKVYRTQLLPAGNYTISYDVVMNKSMQDGKVAAAIGDWNFIVNNKGSISGTINAGGWYDSETIASTATETVHVEIKKIGSKAYFYLNGKLAVERDSMSSNRELHFWTFQSTNDENEVNVTAKISNLTVSEGAVILTMVSAPSALQQGKSATFEASVIGTESAIAWSVETSELTNGTATINEQGVLALSDDALGAVTVTASVAGVTVSAKVEIMAEPAEYDTAIAYSKGGVRQEDGKIIFLESRNDKNGVANENSAQESGYMAILKQQVKGDFSIEFKVKNYKTSNYYPKLMIALGGEHNQIYLAGNYNNTENTRFELFVNRYADSRYHTGGNWLNGATLEGFDVAAEHTYKIAVINMAYHLYVDGQEVGYSGDGANIAFRRYEDWSRELPIYIATNNGTSCEVYDIVIEQQPYSVPAYYTYCPSAEIGEDAIVIPFLNASWDGFDRKGTTVARTELLPAGDYTLSYTVTFSSAMSDSKFGARISGWNLFLDNKLKAEGKVKATFNAGSWNSTDLTGGVGDNFNVVLKKIGGTMYYYVNGRLIETKDNCPQDRELYFWTFNGNAETGTATLTNVQVKAGASILSLTAPASLQQGKKVTLIASVLGSTTDSPLWAITETALSQGSASIDAETGVLTLSDDALGAVTVSVTLDGETVYATIQATAEELNQETDLALSYGGVRQEDGKIIFLESRNDKNGISGDAVGYTNGSPTYGAVLKQKVTGNFTLEFTVTNYANSTNQYPKLLIDLGGSTNRFFLAGNYHLNGNTRIETWSVPVKDGWTHGDGWRNSQDFSTVDPEFNLAASADYKIQCVDGKYYVYLNGKLLTFYTDGTQYDYLQRHINDIIAERNITFTVNNGVSCEVSNVKVTLDSTTTLITRNPNATINQAGDGFTLNYNKVGGDSWQNNDAVCVYYSSAVATNATITFDVDFSGAMNDNKLIIELGGGSFIIVENKLNYSDRKLQVVTGGWSYRQGFDSNTKLSFKIVVENGYATTYLMVDGEYKDIDIKDSRSGMFKFSFFMNDCGNGNTVTVSNFQVK